MTKQAKNSAHLQLVDLPKTTTVEIPFPLLAAFGDIESSFFELCFDAGNQVLMSVSVVRVLEQLVKLHGVPATIKSDNGQEFVAKKVREWIEERHIAVRYIDPGSPWQNGHNESFNGVFRDGCLNRWLFESVREAREGSEEWLQEYNSERPHGSLGGLTPSKFFEQEKEQQREAA